jgi:hypothetical protein
MKNIFYGITIVALIFGFSACEDDYEVENTKAAKYAGDWFYEIFDVDKTLLKSYDYHESTFLSYNTAADLDNEVYFDDQQVYLYFKSRFNLDGSPESFSSDGLALNEYEYSIPESIEVVKGEVVGNEVVSVDYGLVDLAEGKVLLNAATVWQDKEKAKADSIYAEFRFYTGEFTFVPVLDSTYTNTDDDLEYDVYHYEPAAPHYTVDEASEEIYFIGGHRKTGWEVYIE